MNDSKHVLLVVLDYQKRAILSLDRCEKY